MKVRCGRYKWSLQQDGAPSHTTRNTETCSVRTFSSMSQTFCPPYSPDLTRLTCHLGALQQMVYHHQNFSSVDKIERLSKAWRSHCQFITFITLLFTFNVIRQMAPLFSKVDSNKLWHMFRMKRPWFMPNLVTVCSIFLKLEAVKQSDPVFWPTQYIVLIFGTFDPGVWQGDCRGGKVGHLCFWCRAGTALIWFMDVSPLRQFAH